MNLVINFVGSMGLTIYIDAGGWLFILTPALLSLCIFIGTLVLLVGPPFKTIWFAMNVLWGLMFVYSCWWGYAWVWRQLGDWFVPLRQVNVWQYEEILVTALPLLYAACCALYFQKMNVKQYFHVARLNSAEPANPTHVLCAKPISNSST
jgi:hypothetical protein